MVMDFSVLKTIIHDLVIDPFDHALMIRRGTPHHELALKSELFGKIMVLDYQPTCEHMVTDFAAKIQERLPQGIQLHSLKLHETATAYAEWYAEDQL
jgi:6-pyruvoyltetrahydropterin/6-carboxytetrahydropterin synthase